MSAFEDAVIQRIKQLEREVERLQRWERPKLGWTSFTPTCYGWTSGTVTGTFKYSVIGNIVFLLIDMTAGTSNDTNAYINLPVNADLNVSYGGALGMAMDNGTVLTGATKWYIGGTSQTISFNTDMSNGAWTASGTKRVRCLAIYAKGT